MGGTASRTGALALVVIVGALSALVGAAPAAAHNSLTGSSPKDGARLAQAPATVRLTFLSTLDPATTRVTVRGPGGADAAGGRPAFDRNRVSVPLRPVGGGVYTVGYAVASGDGHPVTGDVSFTLTLPAAAAGPSATPPPGGTPGPTATSPAAPTSPPAAAPPPTRTSASGGDGGAPRWPWWVGGAVLLVVVGAGARAAVRSRRPVT